MGIKSASQGLAIEMRREATATEQVVGFSNHPFHQKFKAWSAVCKFQVAVWRREQSWRSRQARRAGANEEWETDKPVPHHQCRNEGACRPMETALLHPEPTDSE